MGRSNAHAFDGVCMIIHAGMERECLHMGLYVENTRVNTARSNIIKTT